MPIVASGKILLGGLVALDILMAANYLARDSEIALWWLGLLLTGGLAAELVDRLGKAKHERPGNWTDDLRGYFNYLCERSGRMMWRWAQWTLVAAAGHLFVNMSTSDSLDSLTELTERFKTDFGNVGLALPWSIVPFLFLIAPAIVFILCRLGLANRLKICRLSNPLASSVWCGAVGFFGLPVVSFASLNSPSPC